MEEQSGGGGGAINQSHLPVGKLVGHPEIDNDNPTPNLKVLSIITGEISYLLLVTLLLLALAQLFNANQHLLQKWRKGKGKKGEDGEEERIYGLEALPGPKPFFIKSIGNCCQMWPVSDTIKITMRWFDENGSCYKYFGAGQVIVMVNNAPVVQTVLKSTNFGHINKNIAYDLMKPFITNGVLVSKGKFWQHERKILLRSMSFQSLRAYITMLNTHSQRFVHSLEKLFMDGKVHSINELISSSFLEVICEMITGHDIHNSSEGVEYHHNFQIWKESIAYRLMHPWFVINSLWQLTPLAWKTNKAVRGLFAFARTRIADYKQKRFAAEEKKRQNTDLNQNETPQDEDEMEREKAKTSGKFRSVLDELVDAGVSDDQIVDEVNTMLFGGHETGASTIHFFCFALALNQDVQELCRKEVDEVFEDPMLVQDGKMSYESMPHLKYLERTIQETLRLYPPVLVFIRDLSAPLRIEYEGKKIEIPSGTNVCLYPYSIHRNPEYFPNPLEFNPDRFLPEEVRKRPVGCYIPFSGGPRNCLGLKFAMIEMKMIASYLLRNFEMYTTDTLEDIRLLPNLTLTPERDMNFIFKRRVL